MATAELGLVPDGLQDELKSELNDRELGEGEFTAWQIIRHRPHPLSEVAWRTKCVSGSSERRGSGLGVGSEVGNVRGGERLRVMEYRVVEELGQQNVGGRWIAFDRCDGRQRLNRYQRLPVDGAIKFLYPRGRLISSFARSRLLEIAWKAGVSNPEGFAKSDCQFFDMNEEDGFAQFLQGWTQTSKAILQTHLWNYLYDNQAVYSYF